ncbi:MAG: PIN domain-containing protein [Armatimonadetes bacterium]|nr:PIN domain-containing protein [Armatimonadota bacterium]
MAKVFFDTNILIYSCDERDLGRQVVAQELLIKHGREGNGVISSQTLFEFFDVSIRKLKVHPVDAKRMAQGFLHFEMVEPSAEVIMGAMDLVALDSISTWDALILSSAIAGKCKTVYSEDMQHGRKLRGLTIINPFKDQATT